MQNQIGDTFGEYSKIKKRDDFEQWRRSDAGYLVQFEHPNEAKFLCNNEIFQRILQQQNLLNQSKDEELGRTIRLDKGCSSDAQGTNYDEFGFERREQRKVYLPLFIPFDQLLVPDVALERIKNSKKPLVEKKNDLINAILQQKTLEHYVFNDLNTVLCREQITKILEDKKKDPSMENVQIEDLKAPNLNDLKLYILRQQSIVFLSLKEARMLTRY